MLTIDGLTIYRRHRRTCPQRADGRKYDQCKCRIWVDGTLGGREIRKSLVTRNWTKAAKELVRMGAEKQDTGKQDKKDLAPIVLADAWKRFLSDLEARKLSDSTIRKYRLLERQMIAFADHMGLSVLVEFDLDTAGKFRATWKDGPRTAGKKLERLRAFFRFAHDRRWVESNPASLLKAPKVAIRPTMPFTHEEMRRILSACDTYAFSTRASGRLNALRLKVLVLLLRYSGMRIGDAVSLSTGRIEGNRLFLYTQKTGVPVYTVLPDLVLSALETSAKVTEVNFFWSGAGKLESIVRSWQTRLRRMFRLAKVTDGHAHRFRDTFAVELLLAGVPMERVSILLGHQSVRVTEKHYNPWVRSRQEQLEADVARTWVHDPVMLAQTKGTNRVHFRKESVN